MRNKTDIHFRFQLPKKKGERFKQACWLHDVYPGTVVRSLVERFIDGRLTIPAKLHRKPPSKP